jgi:hypothetical protein
MEKPFYEWIKAILDGKAELAIYGVNPSDIA